MKKEKKKRLLTSHQYEKLILALHLDLGTLCKAKIFKYIHAFIFTALEKKKKKDCIVTKNTFSY